MEQEEFLYIVRGDESQPSPFRLGTIPASYTTGRPPVLFDGETTASTRTYPYISNYSPTANDRVLLAKVGNGWVIVGKVI